jgi:CRP/FNR family transcriptional regulator, cyclic AMP receptor protein
MRQSGIAQITAVLRSDSLLAEFSDGDIAVLASRARQHRLDRGETVPANGENGTALHFVAEGRIKILRTNVNGRDLLLRMIDPGGHFGLISFVDGDPGPVRVIAERSSYVLSLRRPQLMPFFAGNAEAAMHLARMLCGHLRYSIGVRESAALGDAQTRIHKQLMDLSRDYAEVDPVSGAIGIHHGQSQQNLADGTGLTRVMVSRQLGAWRDRGLIEYGRGFVRILDPEALATLVAGGQDTEAVDPSDP